MKKIKVEAEIEVDDDIKVEDEIVRRNLEFKDKTNVEKRVLIAKDVINQLNGGKIKARSGVFVTIDKNLFGTNLFGKGGTIVSMQRLLLNNTIDKCNCCALGSLFVSCTLYNNQTTLTDIYINLGNSINCDKNIRNGLNEIFDKDQLILIEQVFENATGYFHLSDQEYVGKISRYHRRNGYVDGKFDAMKLLIRIMKNIIKNKGTFIPFTVD